MRYQDFVSLFKYQIEFLSFDDGLNLALTICKRLYFDYEHFVSVEQWGDKDKLMDAILLCEQTKTKPVDTVQIKQMISDVEKITPDTEDFGDWHGSYALNSAASVIETLELILDKDLKHIYSIGTCLTDTIDFKIQEKEDLSDELIDQHQLMCETRSFLIEQTSRKRTKVLPQGWQTE